MRFQKYILVSVFSILLFSCAPAPAQEFQIIEARERTISVNGTGEIKAPVDMAEVMFGIYIVNNDIALAKEENEEILQNAYMAIKHYEIPEKDITIDYIGTFAETANNDPISITRYGAKSAIKVTMHDLAELESLITDVLKVGDVRITAVNFKISELEGYQQKARDLAIQSAKEKARNMVVQFGQEIDMPISIYVNLESPDSTILNSSLFAGPYDYYGNNYYGSNAVLFRQVTIKSTVNVTYSLKPQ